MFVSDPAAIERAMTSELGRLGVNSPVATFRVVGQLERQPTGKMRRFVPLSAKQPAYSC